jgi:hypothetical protein
VLERRGIPKSKSRVCESACAGGRQREREREKERARAREKERAREFVCITEVGAGRGVMTWPSRARQCMVDGLAVREQ